MWDELGAGQERNETSVSLKNEEVFWEWREAPYGAEDTCEDDAMPLWKVEVASGTGKGFTGGDSPAKAEPKAELILWPRFPV